MSSSSFIQFQPLIDDFVVNRSANVKCVQYYICIGVILAGYEWYAYPVPATFWSGGTIQVVNIQAW